MKKLALLFALIPMISIGQAEKADTTICGERGHVWGQLATVTLMNTIDYIIDTDSCSYRIHHDPNYITYVCERCGKKITEAIQSRPDTVILWRRKEHVDLKNKQP